MKSIIIIADRSLTFRKLRDRFEESFVTYEHTPSRVMAYVRDEYVAINEIDDITNHYEEGEIPVDIDPVFYRFDFSSKKIAEQVIKVIAFTDKEYIDDDHGLIIRGDLFAEKINKNAGFHWFE